MGFGQLSMNHEAKPTTDQRRHPIVTLKYEEENGLWSRWLPAWFLNKVSSLLPTCVPYLSFIDAVNHLPTREDRKRISEKRKEA